MKILHTEWSDDLGGQEKRILSEACGLVKRGHYVALVCRQHAKIKDEAVKAGLDVYTLPLRRPYDLPSIFKLAAILKKHRFDVVNTHSGVDSWIAGLAAKIAKVPVLIRTRHLNLPLRRNIFNFIHYLPDLYFTCGENMRMNLINNCGFPGEKVISIPTGVEGKFFSVERDRARAVKYGVPEGSIVVTNVGIFRREKGHEITLKAVKKVVERYPAVRFLLVGRGPLKEDLEKEVRDTGLSKYVMFTGYVDNVPEIYSFTDVAILSSWSEGLPQSLLQAMAAGVPVVTTSVGGIPEVVSDGVTGILVGPGDGDALAEGILRLLDSPEFAGKMARQARLVVKARHSTEHMLDQIEDAYLKLLAFKSDSASK